MGQTLDCFCKGIEFTRSYRPGEVIPDSYDKCEPGLNSVHVHDRMQNLSMPSKGNLASLSGHSVAVNSK